MTSAVVDDTFYESMWVQFDTMGGAAEQAYHSNREWVLSYDESPEGFVIEHVTRGDLDDSCEWMPCPAFWAYGEVLK